MGVMDIVEEYHQNLSKVLREIGKRPLNGYWSPSCAFHSFAFATAFYDSDYRIPANSVYSASKSIYNWMKNVPGNNSH